MKTSRNIFKLIICISFFPSLLLGQSVELNSKTKNASHSQSINSDSKQQTKVFRVHEEWWCDCDVKPARMFFRKNGNLLFTGMFKDYGPAKWQYNSNTKELKFIFPSRLSRSLEKFFQIKDDQVTNLKYNPKSRELTFPFDDKTEAIEFFGWYFYKETK